MMRSSSSIEGSDLKFGLLGKENTSKLTQLNEKNERQFQVLAKESEEKPLV